MRLYLLGAAGAFVLALALGLTLDSKTRDTVVVATPAPDAWALMGDYCLECHDVTEAVAGLTLDALDVEHPGTDAETWELVVRKVRTGMMPPSGEPRPERAALDAFAGEIERRLDLAAADAPNPGAPRLHRLNRAEYANAIRDLLAIEVDVSTLLPPDDSLEGFDNISAALGVSPSLIESYVAAAMKISRQAVGDRGMIPERVEYRPPRGLSQESHIEGLPLGTRGGLLAEHFFPLDAEYEFRVDAGIIGGLVGREEPPMADVDITINGQPIEVDDYGRFRMRMPAGPATIGVALLDRRRFQHVELIYQRAALVRSSAVRGLVIDGPFDATGAGDTPSRQAIFSCMPTTATEETTCAREILSRLATLAFRRPVGADDPKLATLTAFYEDGRASGDFELGVQRALARLLVDAEFLFRFEAEPEDVAPGTVYRVSDLELASRLSFFLWSSIPDEELIAIAAEGRLSQPETLKAQVDRMLADPRSHALVENFAGQWLQLREIDAVEPETRAFDAALRSGFRTETELLFSNLIRENHSILELLTADYTYVDERLAQHYGLNGVRGSQFRRVELPADSPRRGILGHGGILTVTSVANRTSPVIRGEWILENLLGAPVPTPPPGVETDLEQSAERPTTLRERLELHRADPVCGSCHGIMDPVGLSLENFDLIGGWRTEDAGYPINASGTLADGTPLNGPADLRAALLARSDSFVTVATEKLMTYALGRPVASYDMPAVRAAVRQAADDDYAISALVYGVATSLPFQNRMKPPAVEAALNSPETTAN